MNSFDKYVGQVFDNRYKITKVLGVGGMAVVFEAFDTKLNRIVALKMLKTEMSNDSQSVKRFINESKAVSMLAHPNIVSIYDVSVKDNLKYIVMERVDGITLKSYVSQKGVLSQREALSYVEQILRALEHAHSKGIIHRDIKPQNIMLLKNGKIKVTDFGIAKLPNAETVTMTDKAIGTVYYISPEQASGKAIDQRSDLYSLGVMMYEMVTGKLPFDADSPVSVALMQVNAKPKPPREIKPDVSLGMEQIILLAMEKHPDKRFQNASQMLRHVLQIKNSPNYVFRTTRTDERLAAKKKDPESDKPNTGTKNSNASSNGKKPLKRGKKPSKGGRSMFPVILAVTISFLLVASFCGMKIYDRFFGADAKKEIPETLEVPNLVEMIMTDSYIQTLQAQGFNIKTTNSNENTGLPAGTVISQDPPAGTEIKAGYTDIRLVLSRGDEMPIVLEDYTGKSYEDVTEELSAEGINYIIEYNYNDSVSPNSIYRTMPVGGTSIYKSDTVDDPITLFVSLGKEESKVAVPSFINLTVEQAEIEAEKYGLVIGDVTEQKSSSAKGLIVYQSVEKDVMVPEGTKIDITVSSGS